MIVSVDNGLQALQNIEMFENKYGVPCCLWHRSESNMCNIIVTFDDGVLYEKEDEWGFSHFLEHIHFKRTSALKSFYAIVSYIEEVGGRVSAYTTRETISYLVQVPIWEVHRGFNVLKEIVTNRNFLEEDVKKEKPLICEEVIREKANPRFYNKLFLEEILLSPDALARLPLGSAESISEVDAERLLEYKGLAYGRNNMSICITGNINPNVLQYELEQFLDSFEAGEKKAPAAVVWKKERNIQGRTYVLNYTGAKQTNLAIGWRLPVLSARERIAWQLLNSMMGVGFSSYLFQRIREDCALTYITQTVLRPYSVCSTWRIDLDVFEENIPRAIAEIEKLFTEITENGISEEKLETSKKMYWGNVLAELEDGLVAAKWLTHNINIFKHELHPCSYVNQLDSITKEDITGLMRKYLALDKKTICLAGMPDKIVAHYPKEGTVVLSDY